jgi:hypothetical protein
VPDEGAGLVGQAVAGLLQFTQQWLVPLKLTTSAAGQQAPSTTVPLQHCPLTIWALAQQIVVLPEVAGGEPDEQQVDVEAIHKLEGQQRRGAPATQLLVSEPVQGT